MIWMLINDINDMKWYNSLMADNVDQSIDASSPLGQFWSQEKHKSLYKVSEKEKKRRTAMDDLDMYYIYIVYTHNIIYI